MKGGRSAAERRTKSGEMRFLRESGVLGTASTCESFGPGEDWASAGTTPRVFDQWKAVRLPEDPGLTTEIKAAFVEASKLRDRYLMTRVFKELRLETVVGRLADKYYRNRLKYRLFRVLSLAYRLPQAIEALSQAVKSRFFRKYWKRTKSRTAIGKFVEKMRQKAILGWKKAAKVSKSERRRNRGRISNVFRHWKVAVRLTRLKSRHDNGLLQSILDVWRANTAAFRSTRCYFQAFSQVCQAERIRRISTHVRLQTFRAKLQELWHDRVCNAFMDVLKVAVRNRHSRKDVSRSRLSNHKRGLLQLTFSAWKSRASLDLSPIIIKKKVFRAISLTLTRRIRRFTLISHLQTRAKYSYFGEWLGLIQSGTYAKIHTADKHYVRFLGKTVLLGLKNRLKGRKKREITAENMMKIRVFRKVWKGFVDFWVNNRSVRYYKAFIRYRKTVYFTVWRKSTKESISIHKRIFENVSFRTKTRFISAWQKAISYLKAKNAAKIRLISLFFGFLPFKFAFFSQKLSKMRTFRAKTVITAWKSVISSLKYYQSRAMTLTVPARLKSKQRVWRQEEFECSKMRQLAIKRGIRVVNGWKNEVKLRISMRNIRKKRVFRVKKICFAQIFMEYYNAFKGKMSEGQYRTKLRKITFAKWKHLSEIRQKRGNLSNILSKMQKSAAFTRFHSIIRQISAYRNHSQIAAMHWATKGKSKAIRELFINAKRYFAVRFLKKKLIITKRPFLLNSAFQGLKLALYYKYATEQVRNRAKKRVKNDCFSALKSNKDRLIPVKQLKSRYLARNAKEKLKLWSQIASISSAIADSQYDTAAFLAKTAFKSALKWISHCFADFLARKNAISRLKSFKNQKKSLNYSEKSAKIALVRSRLKIMVKTWRVLSRSRSIRRSRESFQLKIALFKLFRHRKIQLFLKNKRKSTLSSLFLILRSSKSHTSTHPFLSLPSSSPMFVKYQQFQLFSAWKRKSIGRKNLQSWESLRQDRLIRAIWTIMKRVKSQLVLDRERTFQLRKDLVLELKREFMNQRLAGLFRKRKLMLKGLKAWRLETVAGMSQKRHETENVFLYLSAGEESAVQAIIAEGDEQISEVMDSRQIALEEELSFLSYQLEKQGRKTTPPRELVRRTVRGEVGKGGGRGVAEKEVSAARGYTQYRHSMRTIEKGTQPKAQLYSSTSERTTLVSPKTAERHQRVSKIIQNSQNRPPSRSKG